MTRASTTMTCDDVAERLADGVDDAAINTHLEGCAACRALAVALREVDGELRALAPVEPPDALIEATLARVARDEARAAESSAIEAEPANAHEHGRSVKTPSVKIVAPPASGPPVEVSGGSFVTASFAVIVAALTAVLMAPLMIVRAVGGWLSGSRVAGSRVGSRTSRSVAPEAPRATPNERSRRRPPWLELGIVASVAGVVGVMGWQRFGNMVKNRVYGANDTLDAMPTEETENGRYREASGWFDDDEEASRPPSAAAPALRSPSASDDPAAVDLATGELTTGDFEAGELHRGGDRGEATEATTQGFRGVTNEPTVTVTDTVEVPRFHAAFDGDGIGGDGIDGNGADRDGYDWGRDGANQDQDGASERDARRGTLRDLEQRGLDQGDLDRSGLAHDRLAQGHVHGGRAQSESGPQGQTPMDQPAQGSFQQGEGEPRTRTLDQGIEGREDTLGRDENERAAASERNAEVRAQLATPEVVNGLDTVAAQPSTTSGSTTSDTSSWARSGGGESTVEQSLAWRQRQTTTGLTIRPRDGWWQSTYIPGDPAIRLLHARLAASTATLPGLDRTALAFANDVDAIEPMLDAPRDRALSVGAFADTAAIDGPTRVRVEVALRSVAQAAGRRGALRVAVVIDADAALDATSQARTRAIVNALSLSSGARDQVALFASGARGGELAGLGPMRTGRLEVALRRLFASAPPAGETTTPSAPATQQAPVPVSRAVTDALEAVSGADGVGLVLVLTPDVANDAETERAIHLGTLAGITTSAIGVSASSSLAGLDAIALAGQGRRRIVLSDDDALSSVRAELSAASELVARAVRVRVRLAEGVDLVDVLGSRPLDAEESRRTRQVEQSIDRDLAQRLGILSDRDEDDDGIRMLLPAFYANDAHTLILDLVVRQPGRVLDVDVTLKDLVRVGNARASASLTLPSGRAEPGPRELRVMADTLAHTSAQALASAADSLAAHDVTSARSTLSTARSVLAAAAAERTALSRSSSFVADRARLDACAEALDHPGTDRSLLGDAARLAAYRRLLHPRLAVTP